MRFFVAHGLVRWNMPLPEDPELTPDRHSDGVLQIPFPCREIIGAVGARYLRMVWRAPIGSRHPQSPETLDHARFPSWDARLAMDSATQSVP